RAKLVAKDDDPHRIERLARIRCAHDTLQAHEIMVFADELGIHPLPQVGAAWMPQGTQAKIMTPGTNEKSISLGHSSWRLARCCIVSVREKTMGCFETF